MDIPQPLRRKPVQKPADSRYVSLFSDSNNKSDITFTDGHKGLLPKSTKLYEVGVDNLSISLNGLSMIPPSKTEPIILEVIALRTDANAIYGVVQSWPRFPEAFRMGPAYELRDDQLYKTFGEFMDQLNLIATVVTNLINEGINTGNNWEFRDIVAFGNAGYPLQAHLNFNLTPGGRLEIQGSRTFWSYFCIHIPNPHYRALFYVSAFDPAIPAFPALAAQSIISLNPRTGEPMIARLVFDSFGGIQMAFTHLWTNLDGQIGLVFEAVVSNNPNPAQNGEVADEEYATSTLSMTLPCNLYASLDERVCIEVGTSLPLTHSALIEDDKEKPDYILGRFMINSGLRIGYAYGDIHHEQHGPSTFELMNAEKRVTYHRLMPQEKVSVLRIQMYIRRRLYDVAKNKWSMESMPLPTAPTDWWHCRLHFREMSQTAISQKVSPQQ